MFWVVILSAPLLLPLPRAKADALPFQLGATNVADVLANTSGGIAKGVRLLAKFDVTASFAPEDGVFAGWSGFIDLQATDAADFSGALTGDLQGISNIDVPAGARVLDAWIGYDIDGVGGIKAGVIDLNSEFDVQSTGALFLNPSHGIGPDFSQSGENGPSIFPSTGLGLIGSWLPGGHWQLKAGLFEGISGDPNHPGRESIAEASARRSVNRVLSRRHTIAAAVAQGRARSCRVEAPPDRGGENLPNVSMVHIRASP